MALSAVNNTHPDESIHSAPAQRNVPRTDFVTPQDIRNQKEAYVLPSRERSIKEIPPDMYLPSVSIDSDGEIRIGSRILRLEPHNQLASLQYTPERHNRLAASAINIFGAVALPLVELSFLAHQPLNTEGTDESALLATLLHRGFDHSKLPDIIKKHADVFMTYALLLLTENPPQIERIKTVYEIARVSNFRDRTDFARNDWRLMGINTLITMLGDRVFEIEEPARYRHIEQILTRETGVPCEKRNCIPFLQAYFSQLMHKALQLPTDFHHNAAHWNFMPSVKSPSSLRKMSDSEIVAREDQLRMRLLLPDKESLRDAFALFERVQRSLEHQLHQIQFQAQRRMGKFTFIKPKDQDGFPLVRLFSRLFTYSLKPEIHLEQVAVTDYKDTFYAIADYPAISNTTVRENTITSGMYFVAIDLINTRSLNPQHIEVQILPRGTEIGTTAMPEMNYYCMSLWYALKQLGRDEGVPVTTRNPKVSGDNFLHQNEYYGLCP